MMCSIKGQDEPCDKRIIWSAANIFKDQQGGCASAWSKVRQECASCRSTCTLQAAGCSGSPPAALATPAPMATIGAATTSAPYDCNAGLHNWHTGWSVGKKRWCCQHNNRGCLTETSTPFDCRHQLDSWQTTWPDDKKNWCCQHGGHGCQRNLPYDCTVGFLKWQTGWSVSKKTWCCQHRGRGCSSASDPYDCNVGYVRWKDGWSVQKKEWCCQHGGRGCPGT